MGAAAFVATSTSFNKCLVCWSGNSEPTTTKVRYSFMGICSYGCPRPSQRPMLSYSHLVWLALLTAGLHSNQGFQNLRPFSVHPYRWMPQAG